MMIEGNIPAAGLLNDLFRALPHGALLLDPDGQVLDANPAAESLLGEGVAALIAHHTGDQAWVLYLEDGSVAPFEVLPSTLAHRTRQRIPPTELGYQRPDGSRVWLLVEAAPMPADHVLVTFSDITELHRSRAVLAARDRLVAKVHQLPLSDFLTAILDEAELLTDSTIGFYHFVDEDQETLTLQAWSTRTARDFCRAEGKGLHYPVSMAGVWADCLRERQPVIHNDYASLPHRRGLPPGHAEVLRELTVPVLRRGKVVALLGIGNKATPYHAGDILAAQMLADLAADLSEQKRSEAQLQQELARREALTNAIPGAVYRYGLTAPWPMLFCNNGFQNLTGHAPEAYLSGAVHWENLILPEDRPRVVADAAEALATGTPFEREYRIQHADGRILWVLERSQVEYDAQGKAACFTGVLLDITARKAEAQELALIFQLNPDLMCLVDPEGRFLKLNDQWEASLGHAPAALIGRPFMDWVVPEDHAPTQEVFAQLVRHHSIDRFRNRYAHADGSHRVLEWRAAPLGDRIFAVARDVTEADRLERELREREALYRTLTEQAPVALFLHQKGRFIHANPAACRLLGARSPEELLGQPILERVHPDDREAVIARVKQATARHEVAALRHERFVQLDGTPIHVEVMGVPLEIENQPTMLVFAQDINARHEAQQALEQRTQELQASQALFETLFHQNETAMALGRWPEGTTDTVNEAWSRITGWPADAVQNRTAMELGLFEDLDQVQDILARLKVDGRVQSHPLSLRTRQGGRCDILWSGVVITHGGRQMLLSSALDISERRRAEQALEASEARFRSLFQSMNEAFALHEIITDASGTPVDYRYLEINAAFETMTGIPRERWIGRTVREVLPGIESHWIESLGRVALTGQPTIREAMAAPLGRWFRIQAYCPSPGQFAVLSTDITEALLLNQQLESERRLFMSGPVTVFTWRSEPGWPVTYVSDNVRENLGYAPEELLAADFHFSDLIHPEDLDRVGAEVEAHLGQFKPQYEQSYRLRRKDGTYRWMLDSTLPIYDASGAVTSIRGYLVDETEQKEAQLALEQERTRLAHILEGTHAGTWEWNVQTGEARFNERWASMLGYALSELAPISVATWMELAHPEDLPLSDALLQRHFAGELATFSCECRMRHRDGHWIWVLDNGRVITWTADGKPEWMFGTHLDITGRKQAELALIEREHQLRSYLDGSPLGVFVADTTGRYLDVNPAACRLMGLPREELLTRTVTDLVAPVDLPAALAHFQRTMGEGEAFGELTFIRADGQPRRMTVLAVRLDEGRGLAFVEDVTDRRALEQQLHRSQKLESLGSLASGVAHDMNNVLGAILGLASAFQPQQDAESPLGKALDAISKACLRGRTMVQGLLGFAREDLVSTEPVDLNRLVQEEVALLERTTLQQVTLRTELAPHLSQVLGDPGALSQALMNLCINAVDAMPDGGTLTLRTGQVNPEWVFLEIADTGQGIPEELQDRIFEPFFTTKPSGKGTGLGLPMVYGTTRAHGGRISLQSTVGKGTTLRLELPCVATATLETDPGLRVAASSRSLAVLLVDDDDLVRLSLEAQLEVLGHRPVLAPCGEDALAFLERGGAVDVVILDLNMPGLGGRGTLPRLRALRPNLPVFLATGRTDQTALDLAQSCPGVRILPKPFDMSELQTALQGVQHLG